VLAVAGTRETDARNELGNGDFEVFFRVHEEPRSIRELYDELAIIDLQYFCHGEAGGERVQTSSEVCGTRL
jgi:hypothetical protein